MMRALVLAAGLAVAAATPAWADPDDFDLLSRGKALTTAGDCTACHTAPGGAPFAGGLDLETPFGIIRTPNITPDKATGIGQWSADDFYRAMHEGKGKGGRRLYPAFPYPYFTKVTRADSDAIFAYLHSLAPVANAVKRNTLPFPFNIRTAMAGWNALFFTPGTWQPDTTKSDAFNRGAYLVEGLGHCGLCHTPMNTLGASKTSSAYQGNAIQSWFAPNITGDKRTGVGGWTVAEIVEYLQTGRNAHGAATGPMAEVVEKSTSLMPESDLFAMATYLKERGAAGPEPGRPVPATDTAMMAGQAIYLDTCQACHGPAGKGVPHLFPSLAGNPTVLQTDPTTLNRVVMTGTKAAATAPAPTGPAMPAFGFRLTDAQIASVVTYIRNSWGNAAPAVSAGDVTSLRTKLAHN